MLLNLSIQCYFEFDWFQVFEKPMVVNNAYAKLFFDYLDRITHTTFDVGGGVQILFLFLTRTRLMSS
jgi:hypothetical protein